ncbi:MAG: hypothetical protein ACTSRD_13770, partial [Promethearchaeota archaeon]
MLKTLLYYFYEHEGLPYENPPHYYYGTAEDKSMECQAFVRVLIEYMMILPAKESNKKLFIEILSRLFEHNNGNNPRISIRLLNDFIDHHHPDITPFEAVLGWVTRFWNKGSNILRYLYITLLHTDDFFSENDVYNACVFAEQELGLNNTLTDY